MSRYRLILVLATLFFAASGPIATAQQPDLIRVELENLPSGARGDFKFYKGGNEVRHGGLDAVFVQGGTGQITSGSDVQFNYQGTCQRLVAQFRIAPQARDRFHVSTSHGIRVKVFVDNDLRISEVINGTKTLILP